MLVIHLCDTGKGIASSDIDKLFKRFSKLDDLINLNVVSHGLGLNNCEAIIRANEGKIQVLSAGINQGTTIIFSMKMQSIPEDELSSNESSFENSDSLDLE